MALPDPLAAAAASKLDAESLLAIKPGASVKVEVIGTLNDEASRKVRNALTTKLEANGMVVSDDAKLVLTANVHKGQMRESSYFGIGKLQAKETVHTLSLAEGDTKIWSIKRVLGMPFMLMRNRRESADEAVARALLPQVSFFQEAHLPTHVARPPENGVFWRIEADVEWFGAGYDQIGAEPTKRSIGKKIGDCLLPALAGIHPAARRTVVDSAILGPSAG